MPQEDEEIMRKTAKGEASSRKSFSRSQFPKLLANTKRTHPGDRTQNEAKEMNARKADERDFMNHYNHVQALDKEKDIKLSEFLGDRAMTEGQIEAHKAIREEIAATRHEAAKVQCTTRYVEEFSRNVEVEYPKLPHNELTFDDNKNDELKARKIKL